jgi:hypothetical protein
MNDVLMIPVTTVQPDLVTQTDVVVYVPLASKEAHGIVKVGNGLSITQSGLLSFDDTVLTPIKDDVVQLRVDLTDHVSDYENPHRVTKSQVGLSNVDNTSDLHKPVSLATRQELDRLAGLISGADVVVSYASYKDLVDDFNNLSSAAYKVGQSVYIKAHDVPDLWVYDVSSTSKKYTYVSDDSIIASLENNGTFQVGYYVFASLETLKVDLSDYVTIDTRQTITGDKNFTGALRYDGISVATIDDVNNVTLDDLNFQTSEVIYSGNKVYYQGEFAYTTKNSSTPISIEGTVVLPIKGDGVNISSDNKSLIIKAEIPDVDTSNLVDLQSIQTIRGVKTFTNQLGVLNAANGDVNYIKHINNNFLISASNGENIINIDEQLKTFNFYNQPLATVDFVTNNAISYTKTQVLTDEQKEIARNNIGAGTGGSGSSVDLVWWEV